MISFLFYVSILIHRQAGTRFPARCCGTGLRKVSIPCSSFYATGFDCKKVSNKLSKMWVRDCSLAFLPLSGVDLWLLLFQQGVAHWSRISRRQQPTVTLQWLISIESATPPSCQQQPTASAIQVSFASRHIVLNSPYQHLFCMYLVIV
jgi:hypothetical protein